MRSKLILVEGLPGSGKSTTAEFISSNLTEMNINHCCYPEDPNITPVQFLWPESPTFEDDLLNQWLKLKQSIEDGEDIILLESVYWQWTAWFMILLNFAHDDVLAINSSIQDIIEPLNPLLVYFAHSEVDNHIRWVYNLRGEAWSDFMIERDLQLPYHQSRGHNGIEGIIKCFKETQSQDDELFKLTRFQKIRIQDPHKNWSEAYQKIEGLTREKIENT